MLPSPRLFLSRYLGWSGLGLASAAAALAASDTGNPALGKKVFLQSCSVCHSAGLPGQAMGGQGPSLAGVVGRKAAAVPDFGYTPALKASGLTWDRATLDRFLAAPTDLVPGTAMVVALSSPRDRADVIAFLATTVAAKAEGRRQTTAGSGHAEGDWEIDHPGVVHHIRVDDLPKPFATESAGNGPRVVARPAGAQLSVPEGFAVQELLSDLSGPRLLRTAPNGDVFLAETRDGRIRVLRIEDGTGAVKENSVFADHLRGPFGIAFYPAQDPQWVYVGNLNQVVRFPYRSGDLKARGAAETVVPKLSDTTGGHTTRDLAFSRDGKRLFISVGSGSNVAEGMEPKSPAEVRAWEAEHAHGSTWGSELHRADVLVCDPEGRDLKVYATGIRNAVGLAVQPATGQLWVATNERDGLGDNLVPDYLSHIEEGGYYGWPWYYLGNHEDPRLAGQRPDLAGQAIVPDVLVQAHSATLELTFYPENTSGASAFPAEYRGDIFAALHGSWNRASRTGSKIVRVHLKDGVATGAYEDFLTGFVVNDQTVWGRPVGVTIAHDGALLVTDDAGGTLWRVSYSGR